MPNFTSIQKILTFIFLFSISLTFGQITIWSENFDSYGNNIASGTGTGTSPATWSTTANFDTAGTVGNMYLQGTDLGGTTNTWTTSAATPINISGYTNIVISFTASDSGGLETLAEGQSDHLRASYRINGGAWVDFVYDEAELASTTFNSISNPVPNGSTLQLRIQVNNSSGGEYYRVDNISVEGFATTDTDGDGVIDAVDLDDDNDGIYDTDELANCDPSDPVITNTIFWEDFGVGTPTGSSVTTPYTNYTYISVPGGDVNDGMYTIHNDIQETANWAPSIWQNIGDHTTGTVGSGRMAIFNASNAPGEFYRRPLTNVDINAPVDISLWAMNLDIIGSGDSRNRPDITISLVQGGVTVYSFDTGDIPQFARGNTSAWINYTGSFTPSSSDPITIVMVNNAPGGLGNDLAIDDILISQDFCDSDGNGIINTLENDSDGDGCTDADEAYANVNADGNDDAFGYYGTGNPPAVNANGTVVAASYTTPADGDGNGIYDFAQAGDVPVINTQPVDQDVLLGTNATFSVGASGAALNYQWQVSTNGGGVYSNIGGATGSSYTVNTVSASENGNYYRVIISDPSYVCGTTTSTGALLTTEGDFDGDGVEDSVDLDDDNDGISDANELSACTGGLNFEFYDLVPSGNTVDNIPTTGALSTGTVSSFNVDALQASEDPGDAEVFSVRFDGYIFIGTSGTYTFYTNSDDGSKIYIDGTEVVNNDGLHGVVEASGTISLTPGFHTIEVLFYENTGGQFLSVEYSGPSIARQNLPFSILSPTGCDQDGDGTPNHLDADSDGDGCNDTVESGYTDPDNDGILGNSPVSVDASGNVTGQGGYGTPDDGDGDTTYDFLQSGSVPSISVQPSNQAAFAGGNPVLTVTSTGDTFQWQISTNGGGIFTNISDGGIYSGSQTNSLSIAPVDLTMNGYQYRVIISNSNYACGDTTSDTAELAVRVSTVITNRKITHRVNPN